MGNLHVQYLIQNKELLQELDAKPCVHVDLKGSLEACECCELDIYVALIYSKNRNKEIVLLL